MVISMAVKVAHSLRRTTVPFIRQRHIPFKQTREESLTAGPVRGEIFNTEQLEQHAPAIAAEHAVVEQAGTLRPLQRTIDESERILRQAHQALAGDGHKQTTVTPAAEWLLDNFHIVTDQIREIREDLPRGYYQELPKLKDGPLKGLPRVYALTQEMIKHTDSRIDIEQLLRFVLAYQTVAPLTMGEIWAVAIMLRVGLVENLGRLAHTLLETRHLRDEAGYWGERLLAQRKRLEAAGNPVVRDLTRRYPQIPAALAVQLLRSISHDSIDESQPVIEWLETQITDQYGAVETIIHIEHQRQAMQQTTVAHIITSMRTLSAVDWADWFEQVSLVEQVLRQDPAGAYARSTFETRDRYRHAVERLARRTARSEDEVARQIIALTRVVPQAAEPRRRHIGYYLVGPGRTQFEAMLGYRATLTEKVQRILYEHPTAVYLGAMAGGTAAAVAAGLHEMHRERNGAGAPAPHPLVNALATGLLVFPASALAKGLVNRVITQTLPPRVLPRLDLGEGIPEDLRTIVVIPMLLLTTESVCKQLDALEVLYLANQDPNLHFALLSDFSDAPAATMPDDDALLAAAAARVEELNAYYGAERFFFLHRRRIWNKQQSCFMGWERKRGKLEEFNHLLRGAQDTTFDVQIGALPLLRQIRYVITLDADTQLPRDAAQALIGTLAHPLNQATVDPDSRIVVEGYGILQPRVGIDLPSAHQSRFARIFSGNIGIDPYTTAVSDVYMDLFAEGIYAGKGIYDPDALLQVLANRFPDNTLLSHDLIEGNYARAGLLSDVELLDSYPRSYGGDAARQHRWVRGDWQIMGWLLPWVPCANGNYTRNQLSLIARYKIFDNLRRSLVPAATTTFLGISWLWLRGRPLVWSALALGHLALPPLFDLLTLLSSLLHGKVRRTTLGPQIRALRQSLLHTTLNLALMPDRASLNLDAIGRTLARVLITRRNLLEWETAAQSQSRLQHSYAHLLRRTSPLAVLAILLARSGLPRLRAEWPSIAPVLADWLAAPFIVNWLDQPLERPPRPIKPADSELLRRIARATWAYFEQFVTEKGNYLAPDNYQETPQPVIAYRASPTNIGLQLQADLAARDFGYIGMLDLTERTEHVFATMERMDHYRGHLLNWYDTQTLDPLPPAYVSTVDSGNLAGSLLCLRQGYITLRDEPIIGPQVCAGLRDTLDLITERLPAEETATAQAVMNLTHMLDAPPQTVGAYRRLLHQFEQWTSTTEIAEPAAAWVAGLRRQVHSLLKDLDALLPDLRFQDGDIPDDNGIALFDPALTSYYRWEDESPPTLMHLRQRLGDALSMLDPQQTPQPLYSQLECLHGHVQHLLDRQTALINMAAAAVQAMDFTILFDDKRHIFSIGYSVAEGRRDNSYYDLLASESRLASFLAIAKGDVPQEHWFYLGRSFLPVDSRSVLASWSGTMFEYLMPLLVMRNYPETLLAETYRAAVARQMAYGREQRIPWGISESAYNLRDMHMNYQYHAFGVPGLGLKSGLGRDLVIAPYATVLALPVEPRAALANLKTLIADGVWGAYGLYEAVDYTAERLPPGEQRAIINSFMVHHQGMSLLAIDNYLHANVMQQRFHAEAMVQATELLLQERVAQVTPMRLPEETQAGRAAFTPSAPTTRRFNTPTTPIPYAHLLSNGTYTVMVTTAGAGASFYNDMAVTRWRADMTRDDRGSFYYIRDTRSDMIWSAAYQPTRHAAQDYQVVYAPDKADFHQRVAGIETRMEITVSPEDNAEVRRISLTNTTAAPRELEVTSFAEVVLAPPAADEAHPAFGNLFVETEFLPEQNALLASRRPRVATAARTWAVHVVAVRGHTSGGIQYETDRSKFIGRGGSVHAPHGLHAPLTQTAGAVLDPSFSLRRRVRIVPGGTVQVTFTTAVAETREQAQTIATRYRDYGAVGRAFELAWTQSQVELRYLEITADDALRFQRLATFALYPDPRVRARPDTLRRNRLGQPGLWSYGISGDYPIILVRIKSGEDLPLVRELLQAHHYWRLKRMLIDLVILNENASGYTQGLQDQALGMIRSDRAGAWLNQRGGIFVVRSDQMNEAEQVLLLTVARMILTGRRGDLAGQLRRILAEDHQTVPGKRTTPAIQQRPPDVQTTTALPPEELQQHNGYGGFTRDGREFVIDLQPGRPTPAPWSNVIANENFGFIVSESGSSYTWSQNSRENRLTPWSNDPVEDPAGEALYLRDETTGTVWSPLPQPAGAGAFRVRHGSGYSTFEQWRDDLFSRLTMFVPPADSVKIYRLHLHNRTGEPRRLSVTFYVEWVLGVFREQMAPYIITEEDPRTGALLARNPYNSEFGERVAFIAANLPIASATGDRTTFIGRNGDLSYPTAMQRPKLTGRIGAGFDPCGALRSSIDLAPGEACEVIFLLGQGADSDAARQLIEHYRDPQAAATAYDQVVAGWQTTLQQIQVQTPQPQIDLLLNGWLLYQTLSCRIWARSAFYQSGGAYGFRDQLQDVMALVNAAPEITRAQILRAAARQFLEGDVQHWWHPPTGRGIRTNFSDDYLWLPFVTSFYVTTTGDTGVLDEELPFLEGRPLQPEEAEYYDLPLVSDEQDSLYGHCIQAIEYGLQRMGPHGLPLMGAGDWNDGMNMVGHAGRGESIWVGWFLAINLERMADLAAGQEDLERAERYRAEAARLVAAVERHAWDGDWYLRAFFDDGTPLGAAQNEECRIDALPQSWAVISGAANPERMRTAMNAVNTHLIDREVGLIKLFTPPFDQTPLNPGYIKGYLPGVRENGGQYTHAAIWTIWAYALLGEGAQVGELFNLINPIRHSITDVERYKVEPYTIAADVYAVPPHTGRGGWTWYTGSSGWLYRLGIEMLLGIRRAGDWLTVTPCIPPDWKQFSFSFRYGAGSYCITVENPQGATGGVTRIEIDGEPVPDGRIPLQRDAGSHTVRVVLGGNDQG